MNEFFNRFVESEFLELVISGDYVFFTKLDFLNRNLVSENADNVKTTHFKFAIVSWTIKAQLKLSNVSNFKIKLFLQH